jgi:hypothetical protein
MDEMIYGFNDCIFYCDGVIDTRVTLGACFGKVSALFVGSRSNIRIVVTFESKPKQLELDSYDTIVPLPRDVLFDLIKQEASSVKFV